MRIIWMDSIGVSHLLTQDNYWIPIQPQLPQNLIKPLCMIGR